MYITQEMYNVIQQNIRNLSIKIELLDFDFNVVDEISGDVISPPSFSENASSDIRRSCSIEVLVGDSDKYKIQSGSRLWIDKYIKVYVGLEYSRTSEIIWFNYGVYLINNPSSSLTISDRTISFTGIDLMAKLTGERNGNLEGLEYTIPQYSDIRTVIIETLALGGFENYNITINENETATYKEINIDSNGCLFDILSQLRDMYVNYEMFFDIDGVFVFQPIPTGENEVAILDDSILDKLKISTSVDTNFEDVKNSIIVLGQAYEVDYYGETVTVNGSTYETEIVLDESGLVDGTIIGFTAPSVVESPYFKINSLTSYPIVNIDGSFATIPKSDTYYVLEYYNKTFKFLGYIQPYGTAQDENPDSPFYIDGTIGEVRIVLSGGDYDNIYSNELAEMRARFELYSRARLNDTISIECIPIYWLSVHELIEISLDSNSDAELYLIQSIDTDGGVSGTQTIKASRYYPYYPVI